MRSGFVPIQQFGRSLPQATPRGFAHFVHRRAMLFHGCCSGSLFLGEMFTVFHFKTYATNEA
jgi:hypothetical protein